MNEQPSEGTTHDGALGQSAAIYLTTPVLLRSIPVGVVIAAGVVATTWTHRLLSGSRCRP